MRNAYPRRKPSLITRAYAKDGFVAEALDARHIAAMAGSPLKRARKQGIRLDDGSVIAFPRMPRVADLPKDWRHWSPAKKIEHLLGMNLGRAAQILCWSPLSLDPLRLSLWMQVWHIVWKIGMKAILDGTLDREIARERDQERLAEELSRRFSEQRNSTAPGA